MFVFTNYISCPRVFLTKKQRSIMPACTSILCKKIVLLMHVQLFNRASKHKGGSIYMMSIFHLI